ncbi:hypothetical protein EJB05_29330, partial [Eragrostis curvula]
MLLVECVKKLQPKLVVIVEEELVRIRKGASPSQASFVEFFFEALHHFIMVFESLASCFSGGKNRACLRLVQKDMVGPKIQDFVGQYGADTLEASAPKVLEGFMSCELSACNIAQARMLVGLFSRSFGVAHEKGRLQLCWKSRPLISVSVWSPVRKERRLGMDALISAIAGDLVSRFISFVAQSCCSHTQDDDDNRRRLERVLLRMHTVVEEAEGRCITNRGMLLQLKMLAEGMYVGDYMLDKFKIQVVEEDRVEGEVSHPNRSPAKSTFNAAKRLRFASVTSKDILVPFGFGTSSAVNLKNILESLEAKIEDMREFVMLLGSCPRLSRQPYSTYLFMDKCMFGRHTEKEQVVNFLLCNDTHDFPGLGILPIIGPHRVGKKTLVQHACKDERVYNCFSHVLLLKEGDLKNKNRELASNLKGASVKCLFIIEFSRGVDEASWTDFKSYLQTVAGAGSKIILIGRTQELAKFGTALPIWLKSLSQEEYWYFFKALAFGSMYPDEHPRLASLGMQIATELKGSFLGANILGEILRANPNTQFWRNILSSIRELVQKHSSSFGVHPEDLLERNSPVDFPKVAFVGDQGQGCMVYDIREAGPGQAEQLPSSQEVLMGGQIPVEEKFDVLLWKSRIPPYCSYIATYEKQKPQRISKKRKDVAAVLIYTAWNLWKERNKRVFWQQSAQPQQIVHMIKEETRNREMAHNR